MKRVLIISLIVGILTLLVQLEILARAGGGGGRGGGSGGMRGGGFSPSAGIAFEDFRYLSDLRSVSRIAQIVQRTV